MMHVIRKLSVSAALLALSAVIMINVSGCAVTPSYATDLMQGVTADGSINFAPMKDESIGKAADFAMDLFKTCHKDGTNTLVSPLSVAAVLSMAANGAGGETLKQMEAMFGMDVDELNAFTGSWISSFADNSYIKVNIADSIWFDESSGFVPEEKFLKTNANYYGASLYKTRFDASAVKEINGWVGRNTDGMIREIIDSLPENTVMVTLNALSFDAEWMRIYKKDEVEGGVFTREDGVKTGAVFLRGEETVFLEDEKATGFIKPYKDNKYAFAAMLPNEGVTLSEYIQYLTGEGMRRTLADREYLTVITSIPKFDTEYRTDLKDCLRSLGMESAFDQNAADFSGIGSLVNGNIYLSEVIHKTHVTVDERGTKAGAASAAMYLGNGWDPDRREVCLNRPFVYMLVDLETCVPFFIGAMTDVAG